ncbi:MAG: DUF2203 domain-containing protein [Acidobacteria bacterium]|nr:DUF2203 domain-containing protein [Acidobacteriota bacterium]
MGERTFNLEEAEKLLPHLERWLRKAIESKQKVCEIEGQYTDLVRSIFLMGGRLVDVAHFSLRRREKEEEEARLKEAIRAIEDCGCLVKDLDLGLIDFPCRLGDREVYMCWKLGEPCIQFWHDIDEGFAGRKPIDGKVIGQLKRSSLT